MHQRNPCNIPLASGVHGRLSRPMHLSHPEEWPVVPAGDNPMAIQRAPGFSAALESRRHKQPTNIPLTSKTSQTSPCGSFNTPHKHPGFATSPDVKRFWQEVLGSRMKSISPSTGFWIGKHTEHGHAPNHLSPVGFLDGGLVPFSRLPLLGLV